MSQTKTPPEVTEAIKKLDASDQVAIQTFIAKLKATIADQEAQLAASSSGDDGGHAHYHGHEKCTHDHDHDEAECTHESHSHEQHGHDHDKDDDVPAWKKKAMEQGSSDPAAAPFGGSWTAESSVNAKDDAKDEDEDMDLPPLYDDTKPEEDDDFEKAGNLKMEASDLKANGDYAGAVDKFTEAILAARPSALLYANRADCLLRLSRTKAAIRDCNEALKINPDSAKALRIRGRALKGLGKWSDSRRDLSASQTIDFDDASAEDLKFVSEKCLEIEAEEAKARIEKEEKLRKKAEDIKKAQEEAAAEAAKASSSSAGASASAGGMPGGMPGGMQAMMAELMSDPELAEGLKNPKVVAAFSDLMSQPGGPMGLMSNPGKIQGLMSDPEVGPFMKKLMTKLGPMMAGAAAGGMGGMPSMAGMGMGGAGAGAADDDDDDDMPDLEDVPDVPEM